MGLLIPVTVKTCPVSSVFCFVFFFALPDELLVSFPRWLQSWINQKQLKDITLKKKINQSLLRIDVAFKYEMNFLERKKVRQTESM